MIIAAAPYRISFAGGGSDLAVFYRKARGAVLSATVNKHVYISIHPYFHRGQSLLKYSQAELVTSIDAIRHPILREAIREVFPHLGIEVVSTADIPSGTGLGSSSTFTVALLNALYAYRGTFCSKEKLARKACQVEIEIIKEPVGKQDQYASAYGGMNLIEFNADETVMVTPLLLPQEVMVRLERNLLLFYTGDQRETRAILQDQAEQVGTDPERFAAQKSMADLAYVMRDALIAGDMKCFARAMHDGWVHKRTLSSRISNERIDRYYERALEYGALGGKLLGAGGGGFLLLYCEPENQERLRQALFDCYELPFRFDGRGARIIYVGERHTDEGFVY